MQKCLLYSPHALETWAGVTSLEPKQAWVPRLDCPEAEGAGEDMPANEPSLDLQCLVSSACEP